MRTPKRSGRNYGFTGNTSGRIRCHPTWHTRDDLNYIKWYQEVMNSCERGKRSKKFNIADL